MVHTLTKTNSVANHFLAQLRNASLQKDAGKFRNNLRKIGQVLAYEISKTFVFEDAPTTTPLGVKQTKGIAKPPVLATILRAGVPLHEGMQDYFEDSETAFISAYRSQKNTEDTYDIATEYISSPPLEGRTLIIIDTMLATGSSVVEVYQALKEKGGKPSEIHIASAVASADGLTYVKKHFPTNTQYWMGDVDAELTANGYIVPGLGDAGDLAYGKKQR